MGNSFSNIPGCNQKKRIIVVGAGFAGFQFAKKINTKHYQVIVLDKNNYFQFQPLMYQVATCGLDANSISYPLRGHIKQREDMFIRMCEVKSVDQATKKVFTSIGDIAYDYLVIATGCSSNYFGNTKLENATMSLKNIPDALSIRNRILGTLEKAMSITDPKEMEKVLSFVIVGGGPTGVELAGAIADLKNYNLPKIYKGLDLNLMKIYLVDGGDRILAALSEEASKKATETLQKRGVILRQKAHVTDFENNIASLSDNTTIETENVFWLAGVLANKVDGIAEDHFMKNRLIINEFLQCKTDSSVYAIGDASIVVNDELQRGHPQLGSVATQMGNYLAKQLNKQAKSTNYKPVPFHYVDKGSMATIGKDSAVADIGNMHFSGWIGWILWLFVHLMLLTGARSKVFVFWNWFWKYIKNDTSLFLLIKQHELGAINNNNK